MTSELGEQQQVEGSAGAGEAPGFVADACGRSGGRLDSGQSGLMFLVSGVLHEVNNHLTGAMGFAHLVERRLEAESPELRMQKTAVLELNSSVSLVRNFAAHLSGSDAPRHTVVLQSWVQRCLNTSQAALTAAAIECLVTLPPAPWAVEAHMDELALALEEILNISIANLQGRPAPRTLELKLEGEAMRPRLELMDSSGPGELPSVLDPQLHSDPAEVRRAFGALAAKSVMRHHGGRMELMRDSRGLRCTFWFPSSRTT